MFVFFGANLCVCVYPKESYTHEQFSILKEIIYVDSKISHNYNGRSDIMAISMS